MYLNSAEYEHAILFGEDEDYRQEWERLGFATVEEAITEIHRVAPNTTGWHPTPQGDHDSSIEPLATTRVPLQCRQLPPVTLVLVPRYQRCRNPGDGHMGG